VEELANDPNELGLGLCYITAITYCSVSKGCSALPEVLGRRWPRVWGLSWTSDSGCPWWPLLPGPLQQTQMSKGKEVLVGW